jgi:hypothetical protein
MTSVAEVFDRVVVVERSGARRSYSRDQFMALPLDERVAHILSRQIEFFLEQVPVDRSKALRKLYALRAQVTGAGSGRAG